ncbi:related to DAL81 - transcriptional activator for allantoin and GABA catabolic genes [Cephalotrichum gorgonifer]|uniref:Related to DAL81 - transcriptional activator for allantoin and GABA catabolic genes n=1 Tax=Cephalotrichum gorgonifer TaxID=2041049 RepID=A0AAE8SZX1_9PEZI|nr:related to DAL81 - transcriptional activator for allantoin and GABA catabolic genes [Cephalotrichum gorgonifer]
MEMLTPSNYESGQRKRPRRRERPCDACRKRKTRCVTKSGESTCVHCQLRHTTCTFRIDPPERTSGSDSIRRTSLDTDGRVTTIPPGLPAARPPGTSSAETEGARSPIHLAEGTSVGSAATATSGPAPDGRALYGVPGKTSSTGPAQDSIRSAQDGFSLGESQTRFAELYGLGSDMEPVLMLHRPYDPVTQEFSLETHAIRRVLAKDGGEVDYPLTFHMVSDKRALEHDPNYSRVDAIEACVRPHGPGLVELFWRHVHPCYPILHKDVFMENYRVSYRRIAPALLGGVYLSALRWWSYNPELSIQSMPDAVLLRKLLKEAIATSYHRPRLSSIQAVLLLLQCQPEDPLNPDHTYAWGLTCQALAISQCLGLHLDASEWSIPVWERNVRKRLSWAVYMQDRWTALAYGRPVHIHHDDWTVEELTSSDFADCDAGAAGDEERRTVGATGNLQFMHMVRLTIILSSVLSSFYTTRSSLDQDTVLLYQRAQPLLFQLQDWLQNIPSSLQMNIVYQRKLSFHGYLHFSYYGVMMTLLRRLIRSTALPPWCPDDKVLSDIRQLALQTAQSTISFVKNLRADHLEAFWYFTSPYLFSLLGSFTTLLLVTSLSSQERSFWQETLNSYLWHLRTMSKSSDPMQYAVTRLEGAILRGLEHALAVNLNEPPDDDVSPMMANFSPAALEYTDFGDWDLIAGVDGAFDLLSSLQYEPNPEIGDGEP